MKSKHAIPISLMLPIVGALAIALLAAVRPSLNEVTRAETPSVWALLQRGEPGYVVMMRHALAPGTGDPADFRLGDCTTQRNLSDVGRSQAVRIGKAFRSHKTRIARVLSSQWCRCKDTARLMNLGLSALLC